MSIDCAECAADRRGDWVPLEAGVPDLYGGGGEFLARAWDHQGGGTSAPDVDRVCFISGEIWERWKEGDRGYYAFFKFCILMAKVLSHKWTRICFRIFSSVLALAWKTWNSFWRLSSSMVKMYVFEQHSVITSLTAHELKCLNSLLLWIFPFTGICFLMQIQSRLQVMSLISLCPLHRFILIDSLPTRIEAVFFHRAAHIQYIHSMSDTIL